MNEWLDVHALLDDELAPNERARVQELVKTNKICEAEYHAVREIKAVVHEKCCQPECEEVWKICVKRLQDIDRTRTVESFVGRYAWGICGAFALVIVGAAAFNRMSGGGLNTGDVARVSASLMPISPPRSQTSEDVKQWLQDNLGKAMHVPSERIIVTGGALGHMADGKRIVEANLMDAQGPLHYYEVDGVGQVNGVQPVTGHDGYSSSTMDDHNCVTWIANGNAYVLSGDRSIDALCQAADSVAGATTPN